MTFLLIALLLFLFVLLLCMHSILKNASCASCKVKLGYFGKRYSIKDELICVECAGVVWRTAKIKNSSELAQFTKEDVLNMVQNKDISESVKANVKIETSNQNIEPKQYEMKTGAGRHVNESREQDEEKNNFVTVSKRNLGYGLSLKIEVNRSSLEENSSRDDPNKVKYITLESYIDLKKCFVAIDTETTGLKPDQEKIIEVCAIKFENCIETDRFVSLVNPEKKIPQRASKVNNITDEMVVNAPVFADISDQLHKFIGDSFVVAHNVNFDVGFLRNEFKNVGIDINFKQADTLAISRDIFNDVPNHKLQTILDTIGFSRSTQHRGETDCEGCAAILLHALKDFEKLYKIKLVSNSANSLQTNISKVNESNIKDATLQFEPEKEFYFASCNGLEIGRLPKSANKYLKGSNFLVPIDEITLNEDGKYAVFVNLVKEASEIYSDTKIEEKANYAEIDYIEYKNKGTPEAE